MNATQQPKTKIRAKWTQYGPTFYHAGKRVDFIRETDSWHIAACDLHRWLELNGMPKNVIFTGQSAEAAADAFSNLSSWISAL